MKVTSSWWHVNLSYIEALALLSCAHASPPHHSSVASQNRYHDFFQHSKMTKQYQRTPEISPKNKKRKLIRGLLSVEGLCLRSDALQWSFEGRSAGLAPAGGWGEHEGSLPRERKAHLVLNPCRFLPSSGLPKHQCWAPQLTALKPSSEGREGAGCPGKRTLRGGFCPCTAKSPPSSPPALLCPFFFLPFREWPKALVTHCDLV